MGAGMKLQRALVTFVGAITAYLLLGLPVSHSAGPQLTTATYEAWTVRCRLPSEDAENGKVCEVVQVLRTKDTGTLVAQIAVGKLPGQDQPKVVLQVPPRVWLRDPVEWALDEETVLRAEYFMCEPASCLAEVDLNEKDIGAVRVATGASLRFKDAARQEVILPVSLDGFGDAYDAAFRPPISGRATPR